MHDAEEEERLLVQTLLEEEEEGILPPCTYRNRASARVETKKRARMATTAMDIKTTTATNIELHANGKSEHSSDGPGGIGGIGNGVPHEVLPAEVGVTSEDLVVAMQKIESKGNHKWWAYLTTLDFWAVLVLGYVHESAPSPSKSRRKPGSDK
jgi:hypothetical protein